MLQFYLASIVPKVSALLEAHARGAFPPILLLLRGLPLRRKEMVMLLSRRKSKQMIIMMEMNHQ